MDTYTRADSTTEHAPSGRSQRRSRTLVALAALSIGAVGSGANAVTTDPPPYDACRLLHHPAAADLGPLLTPVADPGPETRAALLGERPVGTDCSLYDLATDHPV